MNRKIKVVLGLLAVCVLVYILLGYRSQVEFEDKNGNGVWDDVEPFIERTAKTNLQRLALEYEFKSYQDSLLDPSLGIKIRRGEILDYFEKSSACITKVWGGVDKEPNYMEIKNAVLTTRARMQAWIKYNANLSGGVYSLWDEKTDGNPCSFDVGDEDE